MYKLLTLVVLIALFFPGRVSADSHTDPDFSDDGIVNSLDYALFRSKWNTRKGEPDWDAKYDLHIDGVINSLDYAIFRDNWNKTFPVPLSERETLVALYDAMGGPNWTNNTNWNSTNDIATWHGVTVSGGKVTDLDLRLNNLTGMIPTELGNLTNLENLNLTGNKLSGAIPTELGNLTNLEDLNLSFNQLSGALPASLGKLTNLKKLWLVNNQLSGAIPTELGNLTNLEVLILNNNQLSGALPQSLTGLMLMSFSFGKGTDLCAPLDAAFQAWLQGIADKDGPNCQ